MDSSDSELDDNVLVGEAKPTFIRRRIKDEVKVKMEGATESAAAEEPVFKKRKFSGGNRRKK